MGRCSNTRKGFPFPICTIKLVRKLVDIGIDILVYSFCQGEALNADRGTPDGRRAGVVVGLENWRISCVCVCVCVCGFDRVN